MSSDAPRDDDEETPAAPALRIVSLATECPRCSGALTAEFYGPCPTCVAELKEKFGGRARDVEVAEYEPKMNVTPNAVALKD